MPSFPIKFSQRSESMNSFDHFLLKIEQLPQKDPKQHYQKSDICNEKFLIDENQHLSIYFAPHNLCINSRAQILIIGITPGWTQTEIAYRTYHDHPELSRKERLLLCKRSARFAGTMRKNLIEMLDFIRLNDFLEAPSTQVLFEPGNDLLHTTSLIKFPVFKNGNNYSGYAPKIFNDKLLQNYLNTYFLAEINAMKKPLLCIPLGKVVEETLILLQNQNKLPDCTLLNGFPHPSGLNGHRKVQLAANRTKLIRELSAYFA